MAAQYSRHVLHDTQRLPITVLVLGAKLDIMSELFWPGRTWSMLATFSGMWWHMIEDEESFSSASNKAERAGEV
jgi:hypothetical protein